MYISTLYKSIFIYIWELLVKKEELWIECNQDVFFLVPLSPITDDVNRQRWIQFDRFSFVICRESS